MGKIGLIIRREYLSRVKKKSFIIMTILGPVLIAAFYASLIWIAVSEEVEHFTINVIDKSEVEIYSQIVETNKNPNVNYINTVTDLAQAQATIGESSFQGVLFIPRDPLNNPSSITLYFKKRPNLSAVQSIEWQLSDILESLKLKLNNIDKDQFDFVRTDVHISQQLIKDNGNAEDVNSTPYILAAIFGFLIYIFIFLYGVQVLRGVIEEKTNRIIEVIISSVKPFQLMMGKIIGVGMVGLTQFVIWTLLSGVVVSVISGLIMGEMADPQQMQETFEKMNQKNIEQGADSPIDMQMIGNFLAGTDFVVMIGSFLFYFLGGYLLYGSLFAAVGAMVDNESDTQQFTLPVTLPLIFSIAIAQYVLKNPDGSMAVFFSMFPLTSPIIMMVRIPFGVPWWEVILSASFLIAGFVLSTWLASKIYRIGILMYGKKASYKDIWKWLFYT